MVEIIIFITIINIVYYSVINKINMLSVD